VAAWIDTYHQLWDARFRELDKVIEAVETEGAVRWMTEQD
jgi:hypothetical protein